MHIFSLFFSNKVPVIRNILNSNQIARDSRHFEGKSIFTTFLCLSPYVRIQKLGWEIYDFSLDPIFYFKRNVWTIEGNWWKIKS